MANIQVDSVNTIHQTSAALQSVLSTPEEVSPNAQVKFCLPDIFKMGETFYSEL